ncbi:MAG: Tlg2-vesicle protein [Bathelium mastoideum]|nr:MAG: Tlg2-vesicle protein [Bathelium mastoideum]KAI9687281.1 MAG: Tlg2-vesicle protein [Bathelium mastoideum]
MPADYQSTAQALALPADDPRLSLDEDGHRPAWTRQSNPIRTRSSSYGDAPMTFGQRMMHSVDKFQRRALKTYDKLTVLQKILLVVAGICVIVLGILFLVYNKRIFASLAPVAEKWRNMRGGWLIIWALTFVVSFPPLIGYSTVVTLAGFVYGLSGWFIIATATVAGSTASFLVSRTVLSGFVQRMTQNDKRFTALSLVLKHDGLKLLCMIRLCPLPYSLSNGAISTIPSVTVRDFAIATALISPKLLIHVFVGSQLGSLAEHGDKMSAGAKAVSYLGMAIGGVAGLVTGWWMYRKVGARAKELEAEETHHVRAGSHSSSVGPAFTDSLEDEEADVGFRREDDISLHTNELDEPEYRDDFSEDDDARDVFKAGDGEDTGQLRI